MTKFFSVLMAGLVALGLGAMANAQVTLPLDLIESRAGMPTPHLFGQAPLQGTGRLGPEAVQPGWEYRFGQPQSTSHPDVIDRMIDIAVREGVLGVTSAPYRVQFSGPGYVALISPAPVPDGWIVTHRCLERDEIRTSEAHPYGQCFVYEMRPRLSDVISVAWD